jgi:type IV secretory pathway TrbL component
MRSGSYWMVYRDECGRTIQANSHSKDRSAATRLLAERCLPAARARLAFLERLAYENAPQGKAAQTAAATGSARDRGSQQTGVRARYGAVKRPVLANAKSLARSARSKGAN